jgi:hypothetical protein
MSVLLIVVAVLVGAGVVLLGTMFFSPDTRVGLAGLLVLMTAEVLVAVQAVMEQ